MMEESKNTVAHIIFAVAAFPLFPASCLLIIMSAMSEAFSSSVQSVRNESSDPVFVFTKALKVIHSFLYTRLVFGSTVVDMNADSSCLLRTDLGPLVAGTWASFSGPLAVSAIGTVLI
jgi:hypothetical protein